MLGMLAAFVPVARSAGVLPAVKTPRLTGAVLVALGVRLAFDRR